MKIPIHELRMLRKMYIEGSEIEWAEHVQKLRDCYNLDNHDIVDALQELGLIPKSDETDTQGELLD